MQYATSAEYLEENPKMSFSDLKKILKTHSFSLVEFQNEMGIKEFYDTEEVLGWMGY